ncbi:MAG: SDR family NAD(P)-dependent oxidoreductase [Candidatus Saccharibacteria bacterium]
MQLKDKVFILTGVARVGKAVAASMAGQGAKLALTYFSAEPDTSFLPTGAEFITVRADLSKTEDVKAVVDATKNKFGRIDGLVHMAATYNRNTWDKLTEQAWDKDINDISRSAFLLSKTVGDELLKNEGEAVIAGGENAGKIKGKMVFFADWSVFSRPYREYLPYNVAKASVMALTRSLAKELAPDITVNAIAPGPILRPPNLSEDENREAMSKTLLNRWGGPEEIAKAVNYLMDSDFVTGQILYVDGGRTIA